MTVSSEKTRTIYVQSSEASEACFRLKYIDHAKVKRKAKKVAESQLSKTKLTISIQVALAKFAVPVKSASAQRKRSNQDFPCPVTFQWVI